MAKHIKGLITVRLFATDSEREAEDHYPNHVLYSAQLDRGLGADNRRWRWRLAASLDEGAMAADQRLVRPAFGRFGLSGNGLVLKKIRGVTV